jgi:HAMP domain-containing protein
MKIRDLILAVLIIGMVISTGTLVVFASSGISDIKDTTSEASSGELLGIASKNLEDIAISIRDSLDSQMQNQYEMVKSWALQPALLEVAKKAQSYSKEELYEMWSSEATREYNDGEAVGDGNPDNDLFPPVSKYISHLSAGTDYPEIFITDYRGYVIAANAATDDFDQGPDDWRVFLTDGIPVFKKANPVEGGEDWYRAGNSAKNGFYVSDIVWNDSSSTWGIEIISQLRDPDTNEYLGQIKAVFDYGKFIDQFVEVENLDIYEIKIVDHNGIVVATSLKDKSKVNNGNVNLKNDTSFKNAIAEGSGSISKSYTDENGQDVFVGYARSNDVNGLVTMVTKKAADIAAPIDKFVGTLQANIGDKSSSLQRNMLIIGAVVAVVIIVLAALIMRAKVSIPLRKLTNVSEKLSKGEIQGLEIDIKGKDEISRFGESFKGVLAAFEFLKDEAEKNQ